MGIHGLHKILAGAGLALLLLGSLSGCGKSEFGVHVNADLTAGIDMKNAKKDMFGAAGGFEVKENEKVIIEPSFKGNGEVQVELVSFAADQKAGIPELETEVTEAPAVLTAAVSGSEMAEYTVPAGEYMVRATVTKKCSGTILIRTEEDPGAGSADEGAAEAETE